MRKIIVVACGIGAALLVAACSESPNRYNDYASYNDAPMAPMPQNNSFLDRHGDALLAGGAGYLAGKAMASKPTTRVIERRTVIYKSRPSFRRSYSSRSYSSRRR